jgi:hypothetical protein
MLLSRLKLRETIYQKEAFTMKFKKAALVMVIIAISLVMTTTPFNAFVIVQDSADQYQTLSYDAQTGVQVIQDAADGVVISGLPAPIVHSGVERQQQLAEPTSAVNLSNAQLPGFTSELSNYHDFNSLHGNYTDELLNSDLKRGTGNRAKPKTEADLEHNVRSHLKALQLKPEKIQSFFRADFTNYAA